MGLVRPHNVVKITIPPEATEPEADLDIFVYNPSGIQAAASTSGARMNRSIFPGPRTASGRFMPMGGPQPVGLRTTICMAGRFRHAGGNLEILSAPASATLGAVEPIEVSWIYASAGQWYLGAVSHTRNTDDVMGLTFINVDNR